MNREQLDTVIINSKADSKTEVTKVILEQIPDADISFEPILYYGCLQGFKVHVKQGGKWMKLPLAHGHWYTFLK